MIHQEIIRSFLWALFCLAVLIGVRQWSMFREPLSAPARFEFETLESNWELPSQAKSQQIVIRVPVKINRRTMETIEVPFECDVSVFLEGLEEQEFNLDGSASTPVARGVVRFPPWADRAWVQLTTDMRQVTRQTEFELRLKCDSNSEENVGHKHVVKLLPRLKWETELRVAGALISERECETGNSDVSLKVTLNRIAERDITYDLVVTPESGKVGRASLTLKTGEQSLDITESLNSLLRPSPSGVVDVRLAQRNDSEPPRTEQRILIYPRQLPAVVKKLLLRTLSNSPDINEGQGEAEYEVEALFGEGAAATEEVALTVIANGAKSNDLVLNSTKVELTPQRPKDQFVIRISDNQTPEPNRQFTLKATIPSGLSQEIPINLIDNDPLNLKWSTSSITLDEGDSPATEPAGRVSLSTQQNLADSRFEFSLQIEPQLKSNDPANASKVRVAIRPRVAEFSSAKTKADIELFVLDDEIYHEDSKVTLKLTLTGDSVPGAGYEVSPLELVVRDNDKPAPPPEDKNGELAVFVVYTDYLKNQWSLKRDNLQELLSRFGKKALAGRGLIFIGKSNHFVWQSGDPPPVDSQRFTEHADLLERVDFVVNQSHAKLGVKRAIVIWYESEPPTDDEPQTSIEVNSNVRVQYLWLDGDPASPWFDENYNKKYQNIWKNMDPIDYFPVIDTLPQSRFIERAAELLNSESKTDE